SGTDAVGAVVDAGERRIHLLQLGLRGIGESAQPRPLRRQRHALGVVLVVVVGSGAVADELVQRRADVVEARDDLLAEVGESCAGIHALTIGPRRGVSSQLNSRASYPSSRVIAVEPPPTRMSETIVTHATTR